MIGVGIRCGIVPHFDFIALLEFFTGGGDDGRGDPLAATTATAGTAGTAAAAAAAAAATGTTGTTGTTANVGVKWRWERWILDHYITDTKYTARVT